jgi:HEAT repeat protein
MARLLDDPEEVVQRAAASAFEKMRDPRAIAPLIRVLGRESSSRFVRAYAAMSLGALKARDAVDQLTAALGSPDSNLRRAAARALCRIADPRSAETLARLAETDPDRTVRQVVSRYLTPRDGRREH